VSDGGAATPTPILGLRAGELPGAAFLCGDPARVERIAAGWSERRSLCAIREFRVVAGRWQGLGLAAASTGVGAPGTAIVVEELARAGVRTLVRIGNSGGLAEDLALGDLVITTGAVREDGTSRSYVVPEYPAVADWRVEPSSSKLKKAGGPPELDWIANPDILAELAADPRRPRLLVGFAAETNGVVDAAREKRDRKGCDWIVANDVSGDVMGGDTNQVHLISADGEESWPPASKREVAKRLADRIADALA